MGLSITVRVASLTLGILFVLAVRVALPAGLWEQHKFVRLGAEHGLSHNSVYAVLQDSQGFMWFGTQDGLDRWDAYEFKSWKHIRDDSSSLAGSWVHALLEDDTGALWIGTDRGLNRLSPDRDQIERVGLPADFQGEISVKALSRSADGGIWVGTSHGLFHHEPGTGNEITLVDIASLRVPIVRVEESSDGAVWLLSPTKPDSALLRLDPTHSVVSRYPLSSLAFTFRLLEGQAIWFGGIKPSLAIDEAPRPVTNPVDETGAARALAVAGDGTLWSGNLTGLTAVATDGSVRRLRTDETRGAKLANEVRSLYVDRTGTVWVGTHGGVFRYDPSAKPVRHLTHTPGNAESLDSAAVSSIVEDVSGDLWVGTFGGGLSRVDLATGRVSTLRAGPASPVSLCGNSIWALAHDDDRLWAVSEDGICTVDMGTGTVHPVILDKPESAIFAIALKGENEAWLGGYSAIYSINLRTGHWQRSPFGAPELTDTQVIRKIDGTYWFGTGTGTLAGFNESTGDWTVLEELADGPISDVEAKGNNSLWLATGGGLAGLDLASRSFTRIHPDPAWPGSVVYTVTVDMDGDLWLGTNKGLGRYSPGASGRAQFAHFDLSDGIGNLEFNRKAKLRARDGTMILGGMNGLTIFRPEAIIPNPHPPGVVLTGLTVLGKRGERQVQAFPLDLLPLQASDVSVAFKFAALSFTSPEKNRYAYQLQGLDLDWVQAGTHRLARYTSIPPGKYTFRVKASNNDGVWNETGLSLPVMVLPPFWQTWWFRLVVIISIAVLLYSWHRLRVKRLLEMERMRLRIASDLHDELSGELSSIALSSAIAQRKVYLEEPERRRLAEIESTSRQVMGGLRDIVWYINPEHDSLRATVRRMRATASQLLAEVKWSFEDGWTQGGTAVEMTARRDLYLIYKEALNNVVRHAQASRVQVHLTREVGLLRLTVQDDGKGFDPECAVDGNGLGNMRRRAVQVGATLVIETGADSGTRVQLDYPITRTRGSRRRRGYLDWSR